MRTMPAATDAADPPDEPPGTRVGSTGFFAGPYALYSVEDPIANSSMLLFAIGMAPASRSRSTTVASYGLTYPSRMRDAHVVGMRSVAMLSLTTNGTPASGRGDSSPARRASSARASAS